MKKFLIEALNLPNTFLSIYVITLSDLSICSYNFKKELFFIKNFTKIIIVGRQEIKK